MNVKYFNLYEEKDGLIINYIIPIRESKAAWAVEGFIYYDDEWHFHTGLANPDDWEEFKYTENDYLKIIPTSETPKKRELIYEILSMVI